MIEVIHVRGRPAPQRPDTGFTCDVHADPPVHEHALSSEATALVVPKLLDHGGRALIAAGETHGPDLGPALFENEVGNRPTRLDALEAQRNQAWHGAVSSGERQTDPDSAPHDECEESRKRDATASCSTPSLLD